MSGALDLQRRLRLIVITDEESCRPRPVEDVVLEALDAGAPAIQLRMKGASAREMLEAARPLRRLTGEHQALFFVNDRLDVALATGADGVHLGPEDLPVGAVRAASPEGFLIGYSSDDPDIARRAVEAGADYIGCGTVYPTSSKEDAGDAVGLRGLERVVREVPVPVVGIGGIDPSRVEEIPPTGAAGVAVIRSVMAASEPGAAVRKLLRAFQDREG